MALVALVLSIPFASAGAGGCSGSASTTTSACTWPGPSGCAAASARRPRPATRWARTGSPSRSRRCRGSASARPSSARSSRSASSPALTALAALRRARPGRRAARGDAGRDLLPRRLLLRPGRLQGDRPRRSSSSPSPSACATSTATAPTVGDAAAEGPRAGSALGSAVLAWRWPAGSSSPTASPGSPGRSRSSRSGASPCPRCGAALAPRALLRFLLRPATLLGDRRARPGWRSLPRWSGPSASSTPSTRSPGRNTYGPVSPIEALGVWPAANYRLDAAGGAQLTGLAGAIGALAVLARRRLVGAAARAGGAARARRLRRPLPRRAAVQRRLLAGQGADDRRPAGDAGRDPAAAARPSATVTVARDADRVRARLDGARGRLRRRRRLLQLPGPARRPGRPAGPRRRAARLPADPARRTGPLRRPGPLRGLRADGRRHPRAAGRVPRRRRRAEPGEALRHRRRLQPDRLRLLLARHPRPLPLRGHRPRRLEQPGPARASSASPRPPPTCSGNGPAKTPEDRHVLLEGTDAGGPGGLRRAGDPHPPRQARARLALPGAAIGRKARWDARQTCCDSGERNRADAAARPRPLAPLAAVLLALRPDPVGARLPARS